MEIEWASTERTSPFKLFMKAVTMIDRAHTAVHMEQTFAEILIVVNGREIAADVLLKALLSDPAALAATADASATETQTIKVPVVDIPSTRPITLVDKTAVMGIDTLQRLTDLVHQISLADREVITCLLQEREDLIYRAKQLADCPVPAYITPNKLRRDYAELLRGV